MGGTRRSRGTAHLPTTKLSLEPWDDASILQEIARARSRISQDGDDAFTSGVLDNLSPRAHVAIQQAREARDTERENRLHKVNGHVRALEHGLDSLLTIPAKLHWMRECRSSGTLSESAWMMFARLDIDMFHVVLRSALDHLGKCVHAAFPRSAKVPAKFPTLVQWVVKDRRAQTVLGDRLRCILASGGWHYGPASLRDSIAHDGAWTLLFHDHNVIAFQCYPSGGVKGLVGEKLFMYNNNVVDFRRYAVVYTSMLLNLVEDCVDALASMLALPSVELGLGGLRRSHGGLRVFLDWASSFAIPQQI